MPTAYAQDPIIASLTPNVRSTVDPVAMEVYKRMADTEVDSILAGLFSDWDLMKRSTDPAPDAVATIASMLVAAQIESVKYAVNEAGGSYPNPYAKSLRDRAKAMMDGIVSGGVLVEGLTRGQPIETEAAPQEFFPVYGFTLPQSRPDNFSQYGLRG